MACRANAEKLCASFRVTCRRFGASASKSYRHNGRERE